MLAGKSLLIGGPLSTFTPSVMVSVNDEYGSTVRNQRIVHPKRRPGPAEQRNDRTFAVLDGCG